MANLFKIYTLFLSIFLFSFTISSTSIHDLLRSRGLPAGLFPKNAVKSYDLDENGHLQVYLDSPCVAKFETRVFFDSVVRANLSYGGLIGVEGLSQEELFLWLPVKDIIVYDPSSGLILFDIGLAHKQMSLSLFEEPPICNPQVCSKNVADSVFSIRKCRCVNGEERKEGRSLDFRLKDIKSFQSVESDKKKFSFAGCVLCFWL